MEGAGKEAGSDGKDELCKTEHINNMTLKVLYL